MQYEKAYFKGAESMKIDTEARTIAFFSADEKEQG